jgi:DNA-binding PadR family transcriptional regulator
MRAEALKGHLDAGSIAGTWTTGPGRRRREYRLTDSGRLALLAVPVGSA